MICPNCRSENTQIAYKTSYAHAGKLYCYDCKKESEIPRKKWEYPKGLPAKDGFKKLKEKNKRERIKYWTPEMDQTLKDALDNGNDIFAREADGGG